MAGRISKRSRNPPDIRISCIIFITGHADCVVSVFPNVRTARKISNTLQKKTPKTAIIMLLFVFCFVLAAGFKNKRNSIGLPHTKRIYPFRRLCIVVSEKISLQTSFMVPGCIDVSMPTKDKKTAIPYDTKIHGNMSSKKRALFCRFVFSVYQRRSAAGNSIKRKLLFGIYTVCIVSPKK